MVVEGALEGELDDQLGYGKHDPAGRDGGNSRNGHRQAHPDRRFRPGQARPGQLKVTALDPRGPYYFTR
jgi:hypothetical protein